MREERPDFAHQPCDRPSAFRCPPPLFVTTLTPRLTLSYIAGLAFQRTPLSAASLRPLFFEIFIPLHHSHPTLLCLFLSSSASSSTSSRVRINPRVLAHWMQPLPPPSLRRSPLPSPVHSTPLAQDSLVSATHPIAGVGQSTRSEPSVGLPCQWQLGANGEQRSRQLHLARRKHFVTATTGQCLTFVTLHPVPASCVIGV